MNLRNNQITIQELMNNPASRAVLVRRFPNVIHLPIVKASGSLTLEKAVKLASAYVPQSALKATIQELQKV